jgi:uncharacterized protein YndB with AHSA1/START domain
MNTADPFIRALTGDEGEQTVTLVRSYPASAAEVWDALTTPERIARWYGTIVGAPPRAVGDEFEVEIGVGMVRRALLESCAAPSGLSYTWWSGDGDPGLVRIRLDAIADDETRVTVQHDRLRPHRMTQYGGGWEQNLVALAGLLNASGGPAAGDDDGGDRGARWELLNRGALEVGLAIDAPVERVWRAWASAEGLSSWWWAHWGDVAVAADVRVGGGYRIEASGHGIAVSGEYLVVDPEHRLAFTWVWTDGDGETRDEAVDVAFAAAGSGTVVSLRHTGPWSDGDAADAYRQGWEFVLAQLASSVH